MPLQNYTTPRIFVAATRQNDGKTTSSLGLFAALQKRFGNIGYIKPVGQRFVHIEGQKIDEDSVLINDTYRVRTPLRAMSPIAVEPDFTRKYLSGGNAQQLQDKVQEAFDESAWEKDFVIIEGTGHAGVGSVFGLSNATVAKLLHSQVIIVSQGGIGKPIDEISLNLALFEKAGVEVIGVILNKVMGEKMEALMGYVEKGLERLGLPLLGAIPLHQELRRPTLHQICQQVQGEFLAGSEWKRRHASKIVIGAMSARNAEKYFEPGALIITPGDREDLIMACLAGPKNQVAGLVLTGGLLPQDGVVDLIRAQTVPCITAHGDSFAVTAAINRMTVKTEVGDRGKIELIQSLVENHVNVDRIVQLVTGTRDPNQLSLNW
jgi:BioD-like phosphotransacetylase family protein